MSNSFDPYGIQPQGFVGKPLSAILAEVDAALRAGPLGQSAGTEPDGTIPLNTIAGQIETIIVDAVSSLWDLALAVYASIDPSQAGNESLDALCSITGTIRDPAAYSTGVVTCTGVPTTVLPVGQSVLVTGTGASFLSTVEAMIAALTAWVVSTAYPVDTRRTNAGSAWQVTITDAGNSFVDPVKTATAYVSGTTYTQYAKVSDPAGNVWYVSTSPSGAGGAIVFPTTSLVAGTTTVSGANSTTLKLAFIKGTSLFVDLHMTWLFLGAGTGAVDVPFQAAVTGANAANPGTLVTIATPVFGWQGAYNVNDATIGATLETDTSLRVKRSQELHSTGNASADAIRTRVLEVGQGTATPVTSCTVYYNDTDMTGNDSTGTVANMPPHSVLVLADYTGAADSQPALEQLITQAVWDSVGAGIALTSANAGSGGNAGEPINGTAVDSQGVSHAVVWVRVTQALIDVVANVIYDNTPGVFPPTEGTGSNATAPGIKGSIVTFGAAYTSARDVYPSALASAIFNGPQSTDPGSTPVPGILNAACLIVRHGGSPASSTIVITPFERATFSTTDITVNLTGAAP